MGWRIGPGAVGGMQSAWPRSSARPRGFSDELEVRRISQLGVARGISFCCAIIRGCSPVR